MRTPILATTLLALGLAGGLTLPSSVRADPGDSTYPFQGQASFSLDGTVDSVDVDRDRVTVSGDDGRSYTVDTYRSAIVLRGTSRSGETGDLVPGMRLRITGTRLSGDIIEADRVAVQPYNGARPTDPAPVRDTDPSGDSYHGDLTYASGQGITLRGTVDSVDTRRGTFVLRINDHTRTVSVSDSTDMSGLDQDSANGSSRLPVQVGDRVSVAGVLRSNGTVSADTLSSRPLSGNTTYSRSDGNSRRGNQLVGVVTQTGNKLLSRDLKVRLSSGREVTVHVPKNVSIRRNGRAISVHDLTSDDQVCISGSYSGSDFKATRIEVTGRAYTDNSGYDNSGANNGGYGQDGYNASGYDRNGYDRDGYNRQGYDRDGYSRDGSRNNGF